MKHDQPTPTSTAATDAGGVGATAMGATIGAGMAWMVGATVFNKLLTFVAQVVLGWKLTPEDYDVFSTATAVAGIVFICKEAGMRELLARLGKQQHEELLGSAFWLAFTYNLIMAGVVSLLALPLAHRLGNDGGASGGTYAAMLWLVALSMALGTVGELLFNALRVELRFRAYSTNLAWLNLVRQASVVGFALSGLGALALGWAAVVSMIVQGFMGFFATRINLFRKKAESHRWPGLLRESKWFMLGAMASNVLDWGPFAILRPVLAISPTVSGLFAFAFNITAQIGVLLSWTVTIVLVPALARFAHDKDRLAQAALRALSTIMLVATLVSMGLASVVRPLEQVLWHGKWSASVPAVIVLGIFYPYRVSYGLTAAMLMAEGRAKAYAIVTLIEGVGLTLACAAGAMYRQDATTIAIFAGVWLLVSRLGVMLWKFATIGVTGGGGAFRVLDASSRPWLVGLAALGCAEAVRHACTPSPHATWLQQLVGTLPEKVQHTAEHGALALLCGGAFVLVFVLLARLLLVGTLRELVQASPARLRPLARRVVLLREEARNA